MIDEVTECINETNRRVHKCHTILGGKNMQTCKPSECPEKEYIHNCVKCYTVVERCETCKTVHNFPPGDTSRGDRFIRGAPINSWMCPACGAMEMGVDDNMAVQTTLEEYR